MSAHTSVRFEAPYLAEGAAGFALFWLIGIVAVAIEGPKAPYRSMFPVELLIVGVPFVLTVCVGIRRWRRHPRLVEFTTSQVVMESPAQTLSFDIAALRSVRIEHSGDTHSGYQKTSLQLQWRDGSKTFNGYIDMRLHDALIELLPAQVRLTEVSNDLEEPSTG